MDKIEATEHLLCEGSNICTSTPIGSTNSFPTLSTKPTEVYRGRAIADVLENIQNDTRWIFPSKTTPKFLNYYVNSMEIITSKNDTNSCAGILYPYMSQLVRADGIWASCFHCNEKNCNNNPVIMFSTTNQLLKRFVLNTYLVGEAVVRLHLGDMCIDYAATPNPNSTCQISYESFNPLTWNLIRGDIDAPKVFKNNDYFLKILVNKF